jgi:hypothetical protein
MNIVACVTGCQIGGSPGKIAINFGVVTDQGHEFSTNIEVDFIRSSLQLNNEISAGAKRALKNAFGVDTSPADPVKVFGGAVL